MQFDVKEKKQLRLENRLVRLERHLQSEPQLIPLPVPVHVHLRAAHSRHAQVVQQELVVRLERGVAERPPRVFGLQEDEKVVLEMDFGLLAERGSLLPEA